MTDKKDEALKLAMEAADELEWMLKSGYEQGREGPPRVHRLIGKIKALAQPAQQCEPAEDGVCEKLDCPNHGPAQQEPVAYLFTNVQSGDIEASTDPDWHQCERELWYRDPLYTSPPAQQALDKKAENARELGLNYEPAHGITKGGVA